MHPRSIWGRRINLWKPPQRPRSKIFRSPGSNTSDESYTKYFGSLYPVSVCPPQPPCHLQKSADFVPFVSCLGSPLPQPTQCGVDANFIYARPLSLGRHFHRWAKERRIFRPLIGEPERASKTCVLHVSPNSTLVIRHVDAVLAIILEGGKLI